MHSAFERHLMITHLRPALHAVLSTACLALTACATTQTATQPLFETPFPAVAAQFRSQYVHDRREVRGDDWRFWRSADRIEREYLADRTGDLWQRDGNTLFHTMLYHNEQKGIEFQQDDLKITGSLASWAQQSLLLNPETLLKLKVVKSVLRAGISYREYAGVIEGSRARVILRTDLMVPVLIERRLGRDIERVQLVQAHALGDAPWQPTPSKAYELLDFADLGDHERDAFVMRVHSHLGVGHAH
jgi:hypothetical protein